MELEEFEEAIKGHRRSVLAYAYTCSGDMTVAEDVVQEACMTALQKRDTYRPDANFGSWLISIARFIWLRECEKKGIRARAMKYLHENADTLFTKELYEEDRWQAEQNALKRCIKKLSAGDRKIIEAHFVKCWKYERIAAQFQKTLTWVKVRMYRLREALRNCIQSAIGSEGVALS